MEFSVTNNSINLLPASKVLKKLNETNAFESSSVKPSEREINQVGLWLLASKEHGNWYQLLMTIYDPMGLAKDLTAAGFIILTLKQTIFILDRNSNKEALQESLFTFFSDWSKKRQYVEEV